MPQIALSAHLAHALPTLPERQRRRIVRALEKLQDGHFDSGLRVKKLQSRPSVAVWEARVSDAARLLFTYGRHAQRTTETPVLTAHCWTVVFDHDDVARVVRRRRFDVPESIRWILAEEVDACDWTDPLPDNPAADLEAIEADFSDDERWDVYAALSPEYNAALTAPPENLPWYLESPVAYEAWADEKEIPAELILSNEQVRLLHQPLPTFLNGPAGSGKTTLALYRLLVLQENDPEADIAFVTHNPRLVAHAKDLYKALPSRPANAHPVAFRTYQELLAETLERSVADLRRQRAHPDQLQYFLSRHPLSGAEKQLFATDIRAVIKGMLPLQETPACSHDVCTLLPEDIYQEMPSAWAAVPEARRPEVHRLARQYQEDLQSNHKLDDQDTATRALRRLLTGDVPRRYDALVLDEVQDLTEKQLRVALATLRKGRRDQMLLAGDPTQVLGGSGFGWRMPRAIFHERQWAVPNPYTLQRSFRASAPTLRLPQALADLLKAEDADVVALDPEQARPLGPPPVRTEPGEAVDEALSTGHPDVLILTSNDQAARYLRDQWDHPFVWSVMEAKGLEADHVVMYRMPDQLQHRPGAAPAEREAARQENRHVLRLHYVAATRARRSVTAVVDPHPAHSVWTTEAVEGTVSVIEHFRAPWDGDPSSEEWEKRARYYRDREHWAAASECYRKADSRGWARICQWLDAHDRIGPDVSTEAEDAEDAIWEDTQWLTTAQATFLLDYDVGIESRRVRIDLLRIAGRSAEADALQAEHDEATGNWIAAADYHRAHSSLIRAARLYKKGNAWTTAARCYREAHQWARAAECYRKAEEWTAAAECYRNAEQWRQAGVYYRKAEMWTSAAGCHRRAGQWEMAGRCFQNANEWSAAATCFREVGAWHDAAACAEQAGEPAWTVVCQTLAANHGPVETLSTIRMAEEHLPREHAQFLLNLGFDVAEPVLQQWLRARAGRSPRPVAATQAREVTYNGGGWYEFTTWNPETGLCQEKVQGSKRLPPELKDQAEAAREQYQAEQARSSSASSPDPTPAETEEMPL